MRLVRDLGNTANEDALPIHCAQNVSQDQEQFLEHKCIRGKFAFMLVSDTYPGCLCVSQHAAIWMAMGIRDVISSCVPSRSKAYRYAYLYLYVCSSSARSHESGSAATGKNRTIIGMRMD